MTVATQVVLALALFLVAVVSNTSSISATTRWSLLLLALIASLLAAMRQQGML